MLRKSFQSSSFFSKKYSHRSSSDLVRVNAIDHDSCFGIQDAEPKYLKDHHQQIIESLTQQKIENRYDVDYVMSISNRQSINLDCQNAIANQNNLVLPVALSIANALAATFDPLLLCDITAYKKPGYTVSKLRTLAQLNDLNICKDWLTEKQLYNLMNPDHSDYCFSEDKINILYALTHRIALLHPQAQISFNIYDDLLDIVIKPLIEFYLQNGIMIPRNVRISFFHYNSAQINYSQSDCLLPSLVGMVQGMGNVNRHYYETILAMERVAQEVEGKQASYNMAKYITPSMLDTALINNGLSLPTHIRHRT